MEKHCISEKIENKRKQLTDLAPLRDFLDHKVVVKNDVKNVNEINWYLKNQYLPHNEKRRDFIEDIPSQEDRSFEEISDYLKKFSKSIKENENMSLNNKTIMGDWISTAAKLFRYDKNMLGENLPARFED